MAATSVGTGLWRLPAQPVPPANVAGSTFVTIWAFVCTGFVVLFSSKLRGPNPAWPEFKDIRNPTILLAVWYTASAADRWIHYEQHALPYGYILFDALNQVLQIVSTIWLLWGTYGVIWNELERRFTRRNSQGAWWLAAKITIFIVGLISFFYALLNIASRAVWVEFLSLNIIADVATKRNGFEVAMTVFFSVFGLLTILAAIATFVYRANQTTGKWSNTRVYLLVATVMLFLRSLVECILAILKQTPEIHKADVQVPYDIAYGLLTSLYLFFMYIQAIQVSKKTDAGRPEVENLESDVRNYIIDKLRAVTEEKRLAAPPFRKILEQARDEVDRIIESGPLSTGSTMTPEEKRQRAENYIRKLRRRFGSLGPPAAEPVRPPASSRLASRTRNRRSAPPMATSSSSSSAYENLRSASNPQMRNAASVPDMRHSGSQSSLQRFAPRRTEGNAFGGWQQRMSAVAEEQHPATTATNNYGNNPSVPQGPPRSFVPPMTNQPSFGTRAAEMGFGGDGRRVASGPAAVGGVAAAATATAAAGGSGAPRRRMLNTQEVPADDITPPPVAPVPGAPPVPNQFVSPTPPPAEYAPRPFQGGYPPQRTMPQFDYQSTTGRRNFVGSRFGSQHSSQGESSSQGGGQDYGAFVQSPTQSYAEPTSQTPSYFPQQQQQQQQYQQYQQPQPQVQMQPPLQPNYGPSVAPSSRSTVNWGYELPEIGPHPGYGSPVPGPSNPMAGPSDEGQTSRDTPPQQFSYQGQMGN